VRLVVPAVFAEEVFPTTIPPPPLLQVNTFTNQASKVEAWDRQLIAQRDETLRLHEATTNLKQGAASLNAELELVLQRQDEMHEALVELERKVRE
jgi:hypothetical protein